MKKSWITTMAAVAAFGLSGTAVADINVSNVPVGTSIIGDSSYLTTIILGGTSTAGQLPNLGFTDSYVHLNYNAALGTNVTNVSGPWFWPSVSTASTGVNMSMNSNLDLNNNSPMNFFNDAGGSINVSLIGSGASTQNAGSVQAVSYSNSLIQTTGSVSGGAVVNVSSSAGNGNIYTVAN